MKRRTSAELDAAMPHIEAAPRDSGTVELIVRRPGEDRREVVDEGHLDVTDGLIGDDWATRGSRSMPDGSSNPDAQLTLMNSRVAHLIAGTNDRWALAGDQFYVDLDISVENLPPGTRLTIGSAEIEITAQPHTGCAKYTRRFGLDALRWTKTDTGKAMRLRGVHARVVTPGRVSPGDRIVKRCGPARPV